MGGSVSECVCVPRKSWSALWNFQRTESTQTLTADAIHISQGFISSAVVTFGGAGARAILSEISSGASSGIPSPSVPLAA